MTGSSAPSQPASGADTPSRTGGIKRLASKPLKLAASTFRSRTGSSSSSLPAPQASSEDGPHSASGSGSVPPPSAKSGRGLKSGRIRHLRSKGVVPSSPAQLATAARGPRKPLDGEEPAAWLRVRVVKANDLVAKDRNGTSDPFISLLLPPSTRHQTPVIKKRLNPSFPSDGSTFDYPIYLSLAGVVGARGLEGVVWDKDLVRKEYMGEVTIPLSEWFPTGEVQLWSDNLPLLTRNLLSTRRKREVTGTLSVQIGFLEPKMATSQEDALSKIKMVYNALSDQAHTGRDIFGVLGVPAHQGIGTVKMHHHKSTPIDPSNTGAIAALSATSHANVFSPFSHKTVPVDDQASEADSDSESLNDDGLTSDSSDEFESGNEDDEALPTLHESPSLLEGTVQTVYNATVGLPPPPKTKSNDDKLAPKTAGLLGPKGQKTPGRQSSLPGYFDDEGEHTGASIPSTPGTGMTTPGGSRVKIPIPGFRRNKSRAPSKKSNRRDFNFDAGGAADVQGIVIMEIQGATDLPKLKNALRFSFDMDPFVVISFGKKVFRTRVIRHQLNPTWDEKLVFHVRRNENAYTIQFAVLDWDKVSGNDLVGTCTLPLAQLMEDAPQPNSETGLYEPEEDGKHDSKTFSLAVTTPKEMSWESKHSPLLNIRAKYEPYDAMRQKFWRQYASQYDVDETGKISHTELTAMLDSLGSTLTAHTIETFFHRFDKSVENDELTMDELVQCMEREVTKSRAEKAKVNPDDNILKSGSQTPSMAPGPAGHGLDQTGPDAISSPVDADELRNKILKSVPQDVPDGNAGNVHPIKTDVPEVRLDRPATAIEGQNEIPSIGSASPASGLSDNEDSDEVAEDLERVINIRSCPLCHRRRLKRKSEQDIVTHLAICASSDWSRMDRIVTSNYVTSSQAQRKFFTKLIGKVTAGAYSLGANSANILVQDRQTGQLQEEKMAVYVRLGIRVLYKGARGGMASARAKRLLKSLSVKQGLKYNSPESAVDIPTFIAFHGLNVDEILRPLEDFKTFNEFFYRQLKPTARPVSEPDNEGRMVSCADCRMMAFDTVSSATSIWIKGRDFSVAKLLGPNYKDVEARYEGGALGIFRLAPQDYHRFHAPVSGTIGKMTMIEGEYYTVNPQAIRTSLDVYGENVRKVVPIDSPDFGLVMTVWVGAMMVGSILTSVEEGQKVARTDELGYFAFGGSTIVLLFEKGALKWDEDLLANGQASIETLVRVGSGLGRKP